MMRAQDMVRRQVTAGFSQPAVAGLQTCRQALAGAANALRVADDGGLVAALTAG